MKCSSRFQGMSSGIYSMLSVLKADSSEHSREMQSHTGDTRDVVLISTKHLRERGTVTGTERGRESSNMGMIPGAIPCQQTDCQNNILRYVSCLSKKFEYVEHFLEYICRLNLPLVSYLSNIYNADCYVKYFMNSEHEIRRKEAFQPPKISHFFVDWLLSLDDNDVEQKTQSCLKSKSQSTTIRRKFSSFVSLRRG